MCLGIQGRIVSITNAELKLAMADVAAYARGKRCLRHRGRDARRRLHRLLGSDPCRLRDEPRRSEAANSARAHRTARSSRSLPRWRPRQLAIGKR